MEAAIAGAVGETVGSLGEFGLIRALAGRMPAGPRTSVGIGDDSAVVTAPSGSVVAAVDMLLEGRHFLRDWSTGADVGVKAAARGLADIAAMGAVPTALLVALAAPPSLPASWALDLAAGLSAEASRAGAGVAGGDTASTPPAAEAVFLSVTALGDLGGVTPVQRGGARAGDVVAVAGTLGHSAAGYALLSEKQLGPDAARGEVSGLGSLVAAHLRPAPPYAAGPAGARLGATAMIDVSDGLIADLGHVAAASGARVDLSAASLDPFLSGAPLEAATILQGLTSGGISPRARLLHWVLTGGEDHSLAATFPPAVAAALPEEWRVIGSVLAASSADGAEWVTVDGEPYSGESGWQHFR